MGQDKIYGWSAQLLLKYQVSTCLRNALHSLKIVNLLEGISGPLNMKICVDLTTVLYLLT